MRSYENSHLIALTLPRQVDSRRHAGQVRTGSQFGTSFLRRIGAVCGIHERAAAGYGSATAFSFGADDCSIMLSAAMAAVLT
jgi:hypothetical protein